jgi:hypothetical protein
MQSSEVDTLIQDYRSLTKDKFIERYKNCTGEYLKNALITRYNTDSTTLVGKHKRTLAKYLHEKISLSPDANEEAEQTDDETQEIDKLDEDIWDYRFDMPDSAAQGRRVIQDKYSEENLRNILRHEFADVSNDCITKKGLVDRIVKHIKEFQVVVYAEDARQATMFEFATPPDAETGSDATTDIVDAKLRREFGESYEYMGSSPKLFRESYSDGWDNMAIKSTANSNSVRSSPAFSVLWRPTNPGNNECKFFSVKDWNSKIDDWYKMFPKIKAPEKKAFNPSHRTYCWDQAEPVWQSAGNRPNTRSAINPFIPNNIKKKFKVDMWGNVVTFDVRITY